MMARQSALKQPREATEETSVRGRIIDAAFAAFMESGYAATTTLEIATRAHVSKRALYALFGNKQEMLVACISQRAARLRVPADLPVPHDREALAQVLAGFGTQILSEVSDPAVVAVFRLAIAEAARAPEVAQTLTSVAREASRAALFGIMTQAKASGLLDGRPTEMAEQFSALLWGNLMIGLLLRVVERPSPREITRRAREAAAAFLLLYPDARNLSPSRPREGGDP
jgi:AcrR family transcriptional regulator